MTTDVDGRDEIPPMATPILSSSRFPLIHYITHCLGNSMGKGNKALNKLACAFSICLAFLY